MEESKSFEASEASAVQSGSDSSWLEGECKSQNGDNHVMDASEKSAESDKSYFTKGSEMGLGSNQELKTLNEVDQDDQATYSIQS